MRKTVLGSNYPAPKHWRGVCGDRAGGAAQRYNRGIMKSSTEYLAFTVPARVGFINITPDVEKIVQASGVQGALVPVNAMPEEEQKNV